MERRPSPLSMPTLPRAHPLGPRPTLQQAQAGAGENSFLSIRFCLKRRDFPMRLAGLLYHPELHREAAKPRARGLPTPKRDPELRLPLGPALGTECSLLGCQLSPTAPCKCRWWVRPHTAPHKATRPTGSPVPSHRNRSLNGMIPHNFACVCFQFVALQSPPMIPFALYLTKEKIMSFELALDSHIPIMLREEKKIPSALRMEEELTQSENKLD